MQICFTYLPTDDIYKAAERGLSVVFGFLASKSSFQSQESYAEMNRNNPSHSRAANLPILFFNLSFLQFKKAFK